MRRHKQCTHKDHNLCLFILHFQYSPFLFNRWVYGVVALLFLTLINEKDKNVMSFRHFSTYKDVINATREQLHSLVTKYLSQILMCADFKCSKFVCHNLKVSYRLNVCKCRISYIISYQFSFYYLKRHISHLHKREIDPECKLISLQKTHHLKNVCIFCNDTYRHLSYWRLKSCKASNRHYS